MFIVMHCMGMSFNGSTIHNESLGGSETAAFYVAKGLAAAGHSVTMFTEHKEEGIWDGVRYLNVGPVNEQYRLGSNFMFYAMHTPHDILIIQRDAAAFQHSFASKINYWWVHDLALHRNAGMAKSQLWNVDRIFTVSEYHSQQICDVYGLEKELCVNIKNAVDPTLFGKPRQFKKGLKRLLYSSRPERGLENLVKPGGIMELLGPDYHLSVCAYDNVTDHMKDYYQYLTQLCKQAPNVTIEGSLTKQELATLMCKSDLLIYPTVFEEVSCITAMEAMAAGLPMLTSRHAALKETCKNSGTAMLDLVKDHEGELTVDIEQFVKKVKFLFHEKDAYADAVKAQLKAAKSNTWDRVVTRILETSQLVFESYSQASQDKLNLANSDIFTFDHAKPKGKISESLFDEVKKQYSFIQEAKFDEHYRKIYEAFPETRYEEDLTSNARFETVVGFCVDLPGGSSVLDYGCAHGHYTINMAKRFPKLQFVGWDISQDNIDFATRWADREGLSNVCFERNYIDESTRESESNPLLEQSLFALIIVAEVLEHVKDPQRVIRALNETGLPDVRFVLTTPYGPWESQKYQERYLLREHIHQFERKDLHEMFGNLPDFDVKVIPSGANEEGQNIGSYIVSFKTTDGLYELGNIDYLRKSMEATGIPTVSLCMIVHSSSTTIARAIESVIGIVDEVIIGFDPSTDQETRDIVDRLACKHSANGKLWKITDQESPLKIGFAEARNQTIKEASGDWILWIDTDEYVFQPKRLVKYLRNNMFDGFAIKQHHFSVSPLGVLKTDLPVKIFRNRKGIKFYGVVHEHPETKLNAGIGHAWLIPDMEIIHDAYESETIRKQRFERNIGLLKRDRKENPDRILGKSLWIRDLAQSIKFELESNGSQPTESMFARAEEGVALWFELLKENTRMAAETLEYYSSMVMLLHPRSSVDYGFSVQAQPATGQMDMDSTEKYQGTFLNPDHAKAFFAKVEADKLSNLDSRYM